MTQQINTTEVNRMVNSLMALRQFLISQIPANDIALHHEAFNAIGLIADNIDNSIERLMQLTETPHAQHERNYSLLHNAQLLQNIAQSAEFKERTQPIGKNTHHAHVKRYNKCMEQTAQLLNIIIRDMQRQWGAMFETDQLTNEPAILKQ